jgi:hypothetical protein
MCAQQRRSQRPQGEMAKFRSCKTREVVDEVAGCAGYWLEGGGTGGGVGVDTVLGHSAVWNHV